MRITLLLLAFALTASCSVYKSNGRKSFEDNAPGKLQASSIEDVVNSTSCWNQPSNEALWHVEESAPMTITKLNEDEIQICVTSQPSSSH